MLTERRPTSPPAPLKADSHRRLLRTLGCTAAAVAIIGATLFSGTHYVRDDRYAFFQADHPIDVISSQGGRWFYYMPDQAMGNKATLANAARRELLEKGFTEDTSNKPWFHFVNGEREVIVCNHEEIATNGSQIIHGMNQVPPQSHEFVVVWVRQPGSDDASVAWFQVKKFFLRW